MGPEIVEWSVDANSLVAKPWPMITARVTPDNWDTYKLTHYFRNPMCLCSRTDGIPREMKVWQPMSGRLSGQWVASCAQETRCGYWVLLEKMYAQRGLLIGRYPERPDPIPSSLVPNVPLASQAAAIRPMDSLFDMLIDSDEEVEMALMSSQPSGQMSPSQAPVPFPSSSRTNSTNSSPTRPAALPIQMDGISRTGPASTEPRSLLSLLLELNSGDGNGIEEEAFAAMFRRCTCGRVTTKRTFSGHRCLPGSIRRHRTAARQTTTPTSIIDLTLDDN
ncbi:hypothetical protein BDP27DRAFT_1369734 [Rhodocollybia butyracea]|uniref:Uncharacterized protein n=1 Tax=Rhodocollybia butyracea TaxID=206335 RepID=A0A9P5U005_9AGAR|nr:hypothetical protein BDP27DRAFT_1369734 [Rhodocollybia butyracea]